MNKSNAIVSGMMGTALLIAGCHDPMPPSATVKRGLAAPRTELDAALAKAKEQATEEKDAYERRIRLELDQLDARWQELSSRGPQRLAEAQTKANELIEELKKTLLSRSGTGPARVQLEESLARLRGQVEQVEKEGRELLAEAERQRDQTRVVFARVRAAPSDAWNDARRNMDTALAEFKTALAGASERVGQPTAPAR